MTSEVRAIDLLFIPRTVPTALGLLGRLCAQPCLLEPYRNTPDPEAVRLCLLRLFIYQGDQKRTARRELQNLSEAALAVVWILTPTISRARLRGLHALPHPAWPSGVYFLGADLRAAIVAIHQLPVTADTLWLRVLGQGGVQRRAIQELLTLPEADPLRSDCVQRSYGW